MSDTDIVANLNAVKTAMNKALDEASRPADDVTLVAVSKTFGIDHIRLALQAGHRVFGENRVQEASEKWPELRVENPDIQLHLIGPLQTNKARDAVALFDVIETVDRPKLAAKLVDVIADLDRHPVCMVQVNTGEEAQKAGVLPKETLAFVRQCREEIGLPVKGLMCIPPADEYPAPHFALLHKLAGVAGLPFISMGMSADYEMACQLGATHVRVGSGIFGQRG